eukprot:scaffold670_cov333-Pavlova_lutheri.AAC.17
MLEPRRHDLKEGSTKLPRVRAMHACTPFHGIPDRWIPFHPSLGSYSMVSIPREERIAFLVDVCASSVEGGLG